MRLRSEILVALLVSILLLSGCNTGDRLAANNSSSANVANSDTAKSNSTATKPNDDGTIPSGTGTEKEKPAAGKANVQGKAFYNDKPAVGVEVKLCKSFSQFSGGCGGETFTAKTDDAGEYLIKDVPPDLYEGLTVRVFNTPYYVFATSGIISAAKYKIEADETYFAPDTHLFKNDVKLAAPRAGSTIGPENLEVKWDAYPDAAYYKLSLFADATTAAEAPYDYIGRRVDGLSIVLDKPLKPGTYNPKVEAYNASDRKLAQSSNEIKFTVK